MALRKAVIEPVQVTITTNHEGRQVAYVDGLRTDARQGQSAYEAAIGRAALLAKELGSGKPRSIPVIATEEDGTSWHILVDENGVVSQDERATGLAAGGEAEALSPSSPTEPLMVAAPADATGPRRVRLRLPRVQNRRAAAVIAAAVIALGSVTAVAVRVLTHDESNAPRTVETVAMSQGGTLAGVAPPAEWQRDALWHSPPLLREAGRAVVTGGSVGMVTAQREVVLVDAGSGKTIWSAPLPEGEVRGALSWAGIDGAGTLGIQVGARYVWWSLTEGTPGGIDLPEGATVTVRGDQPVVALDGQTVALIQRGELVKVAVPQGATVWAARADGVVTATSTRGWWHLRAGQPAPGSPTSWPAAATITPTPIAWVGGKIITILPPMKKGGPAGVVVFADEGRPVSWLMQQALPGPASTYVGAKDLRWMASTGGTWGIYGRAMVDIQSGVVWDLGAQWKPEWVAQDRAFGSLDGRPAVVGPDLPLSYRVGGEASIEDNVLVLRQSAAALVRTRDTSTTPAQEVLWCLPSRTDLATTAPVPTAIPKP